MKGKSFRNTKQRQVILSTLRKNPVHPTAGEIHQLVKKINPHIGLATIYRNLKFLVNQKMAIKLQFMGREARYDGTTDHHLHLICTHCNEVGDVMDCKGIAVQSEQMKHSGFLIFPAFAELYGVCRRCQ